MSTESEQFFFKEKVIVITGSTMGIGFRLATEFSALGAFIVLNGRNTERLDKCAAQLRNAGATVLAVAGDVSRPEDCKRLIDSCIQTFGRIDILINNAGVNMWGTIEVSDTQTLHKVMEINFWGAVWATQAALPHLRQSRGSVLFISSIAAFHGLPLNAVYSASKRALGSLAESLRIEEYDSGIHFGVAYIGLTETDEAKTVFDQDGGLIPRPVVSGGPRPQPIGMVTPGIRHMIRLRSKQRIFSGIGRLNYWANRFAPGLAHLILLANYKKRTL